MIDINPDKSKGTLSERFKKADIVKYTKNIIDEINAEEPNQETLYKIVELIQTSNGSESWYDDFKQALYNWVDSYGKKPFKSYSDVEAFVSRIKQGKGWKPSKIFIDHEKRRTITDKIKGNEEIKINPLIKRSILHK